jgi:phosphomannomutase
LTEGLEPVDCGVLPTPALALYAMGQNAAALMITGSHIPDDRNGVKFYRPDGEIDKNDELAISELAPQCAGMPSPQGRRLMRDRSLEASAGFIERYRGFAPDGLLQGLRIGLYEHSSAAKRDPRRHSSGGRCQKSSGSADRRSSFRSTQRPCPRKRGHWLRAGSSSEGLDGLVSADGDGDRPMVVDETGQVVRGDALGLMVARYLGADAVVTPVTSNSGIETRCDADGQPHKSRLALRDRRDELMPSPGAGAASSALKPMAVF